jgi:hypothetical protein
MREEEPAVRGFAAIAGSDWRGVPPRGGVPAPEDRGPFAAPVLPHELSERRTSDIARESSLEAFALASIGRQARRLAVRRRYSRRGRGQPYKWNVRRYDRMTSTEIEKNLRS